MNTFLRKSFNEYARQTDLRKNFARYNELVYRLFENTKIFDRIDLQTKIGSKDEVYLLLLTPLIEIAWADGRVTSRESDAVLLVADSYGLTDFEDAYCSLMETMISRPSPKMTARSWHRLHQLMVNISEREFEILGESIQVQAQYVAEQSSNSLIGFLRGDGVCRDEETVLQKIGEELKKVRLLRAEMPDPVFAGLERDYEKLLPLVPLIKVAWAEGRITRREREIILETASRFGIEPETTAHQRLLDWLELHPTDDFYNASLEKISRSWENLDAHERALRSLDVLSDCALVAEASGGNQNFPAGGTRVCDEEIAALRRIERKLNGDGSMALS